MILLEQETELNKMSGEILGAAVAVHKALGHGIYEGVYGDAFDFGEVTLKI